MNFLTLFLKLFLKDSTGSQRKRSYEVHPTGHSVEANVALPRRHSMAKVHQQNIEAPIRKVSIISF